MNRTYTATIRLIIEEEYKKLQENNNKKQRDVDSWIVIISHLSDAVLLYLFIKLMQRFRTFSNICYLSNFVSLKFINSATYQVAVVTFYVKCYNNYVNNNLNYHIL